MRLTKTNPGGIMALSGGVLKAISKSVSAMTSHEWNGERIQYWFDGFKQERVIKLANRVYENSQLVDVDSLSELVELETTHRDLAILYHVDKLAYVRKIGKEIAFIVLDFTGLKAGRETEMVIGNYNFISASFYPESDMEAKKELLRILIYLFYGDITERFIAAKGKAKLSTTQTLFNDSPAGIWYANSLWRQRINVSGFKVRGHFRMQPHGEGRAKRKLIWIEDFSKTGYRRKSTVELLNKKNDQP